MKTSSGFKNITRVDHDKKHTYGWLVRIVFAGKRYQRFFSDLAEKGKRASLKAAVKWRNKVEKKIGKPRTERRIIMHSPRNKVGVIGIRKGTKAMTRDGKKKGPVYEVTWFPKPGVVRKTTVSIYKYGRKEAFRRALSIRRKGEKMMYGEAVSPKMKK